MSTLDEEQAQRVIAILTGQVKQKNGGQRRTGSGGEKRRSRLRQKGEKDKGKPRAKGSSRGGKPARPVKSAGVRLIN